VPVRASGILRSREIVNSGFVRQNAQRCLPQLSQIPADGDNTVWQLTEGHCQVCEEVMVVRTTGRLQAKHVSAAAEAVETALKR
jgi:hypothetical protein